MVFSLLASALSLVATPASLESIQAAAARRDPAALEALAAPELKGKFTWIARPGAFGVGERDGWTVHPLSDTVTKREYVVFSTALTTQDYGDQIFELKNGRMVRHHPETETLEVAIGRAEFDLTFDLPKKELLVTANIRFRSCDHTEEVFFVRLGPNHRVTRLVDEAGKPVWFRQAGGVLAIRREPGSTVFRYRMDYRGIVNRPQFAGAITDREVMLTNDLWWPSIGRMPYRFTTRTQVPATWDVVAQGERTGDEVKGGTRTVSYRMDLPVSYLSLSAGEFRTARRKVGRWWFQGWSRELSEAQLQQQLDLFPPVLQYFDRTFGAYPFSWYGFVDSKLYGGGALEAYSYATYGTGWLPDEDPHEPSHTWWGGIVPNTYLTSFWNESFAMFCEGLYMREGSVGSVPDQRRAFVTPAEASPSYNEAPMIASGVMDGGLASDLGYGKGGFVLQQLEYEMGTTALTQAMRKWVSSHAKGEKAEWEDFEKVVGEDWKWFFDQWIRRPGYPRLTWQNLAWRDGVLTGEAVYSGDNYRMDVELLARGLMGDRHTRVSLRPEPGQTRVPFRVELPQRPLMVTFDPWDRVLTDIQRPELPFRFAQRRAMPAYVDPARGDWTPADVLSLAQPPKDPTAAIWVGHPDTMPQLKPWLAQAGVRVTGMEATYRGRKIRLDAGAVLGAVTLADGKTVRFRVGRVDREPRLGAASVAMVDRLGRFLVGESQPRDRGPWTFAIN